MNSNYYTKEKWCFSGDCRECGDSYTETDDCKNKPCNWRNVICPYDELGTEEPTVTKPSENIWYPKISKPSCQIDKNITNLLTWLRLGSNACVPSNCVNDESPFNLNGPGAAWYIPEFNTRPNAHNFCSNITLPSQDSNYIGAGVGASKTLREGVPPLSLTDHCCLFHDITSALCKTSDDVRLSDFALLNNLSWVKCVHGEPDWNTIVPRRGFEAITAVSPFIDNQFASNEFENKEIVAIWDMSVKAIDKQSKDPDNDPFIATGDFCSAKATVAEQRVIVDFGNLEQYRSPVTGEIELIGVTP